MRAKPSQSPRLAAGHHKEILMRLHRLAPLGLLLLLFTASCSEDGITTGPGHPGDALHAISDGAHEGTEGFYFLPPMVKKPAYSGAFDATLSPVVEICESPVCMEIHASFSMTDGFGSELVRLDEDAEHYKVNWHTDQTGTEVGHTYRVRVSVAGVVLGFVDIMMAGNGKEARNTITDDVIGLVDGRTLPITFRIEERFSFVVGPAGGIFDFLLEAVMVEIPQGALEESIRLSVYTASDETSDPDVVPELVYEFLPSPYSFNEPVIVTIAFDPERLPAGIAAAELRLLALVDDEWVQLPGSAVDVATSTVRGPLHSFSRKAVGRGKAHAVAVAPAAASLDVGETQQFEASVTNVDDEEMDRSVQWSSSDEAIVTVNAEGLATAVALGNASIEARVGNVSGSAGVTVAPPAAVVERIVVLPETATIEESATQQFSATVYDQYDEVMEGQAVAWSSSDEAVATVDPTGLAGGVGIGGVTLTAAIGAVSGSAELTVRGVGSGLGAIDRIRVSPASATVEEGATQQFSATVYDVNDAIVHGEPVTWSSSDEAIASVSASGMATGVNVGLSTITATIGDINGDAMLTVEEVAPGPDILPGTITAGHSQTCGLDISGNAYCWGGNAGGELGDGTTTNRSTPVAVSMPAGVTFTTISAAGHTVALTSTGDVYAWGWNDYGQLGDGTTINRSTPVAVSMPAGVQFAVVSAAEWHTVALTSTGQAYAWGFNGDGALGDGTTTDRTRPVAVSMPAGVTFSAITGGMVHTVALTATGDAYAWGWNVQGQLGDGTTSNRTTPVAVSMPPGVTFTALGVGGEHTVALTSAGDAYSWGWNGQGQLGDGTTTYRNTPVAVSMPPGVTFTAIASGDAHTVALTSTGDAYSWGQNTWGGLGDGTSTNRNTPVAASMPPGVTFTAVSAGGRHSVALTSMGGAWAWGYNAWGQLGDGTTTNRHTPVQVIGGITFDQ